MLNSDIGILVPQESAPDSVFSNPVQFCDGTENRKDNVLLSIGETKLPKVENFPGSFGDDGASASLAVNNTQFR